MTVLDPLTLFNTVVSSLMVHLALWAYFSINKDLNYDGQLNNIINYDYILFQNPNDWLNFVQDDSDDFSE
jgi:hypothetical protein